MKEKEPRISLLLNRKQKLTKPFYYINQHQLKTLFIKKIKILKKIIVTELSSELGCYSSLHIIWQTGKGFIVNMAISDL